MNRYRAEMTGVGAESPGGGPLYQPPNNYSVGPVKNTSLQLSSNINLSQPILRNFCSNTLVAEVLGEFSGFPPQHKFGGELAGTEASLGGSRIKLVPHQFSMVKQRMTNIG